jgi:hypothetical protein
MDLCFLLDDPVTDLIDLSNPGTNRTDTTQSEIGEISSYKIENYDKNFREAKIEIIKSKLFF